MAVIKCTCDHEFQDRAYGHKRRVHVPTSKGEGEFKVYRCSVCESEHTSKGSKAFNGKRK